MNNSNNIDNIIIFDAFKNEFIDFNIEGDKLPHLFNHNWCYYNSDHKSIFIYGGCTLNMKLNGDGYVIEYNISDDKLKLNIKELNIENNDSVKLRMCHSLVLNKDIYLIGGCSIDYKEIYKDVWRLKDNKWKKLYDLDTARCSSVCGSIDNNIIMFGGFVYRGRFYDTNELLTISKKNEMYISTKNTLPGPRRLHCCATYKNVIFLFGGFNNFTSYNDLYVFYFKKDDFDEVMLDFINYQREEYLNTSKYNFNNDKLDENEIQIIKKEKLTDDMVKVLTDDDLHNIEKKNNINTLKNKLRKSNYSIKI